MQRNRAARDEGEAGARGDRSRGAARGGARGCASRRPGSRCSDRRALRRASSRRRRSPRRSCARRAFPRRARSRCVDAAAAKRAAREFGAPVVIKASGLAAGKGVIVCETIAEADAAIDCDAHERQLRRGGARGAGGGVHGGRGAVALRDHGWHDGAAHARRPGPQAAARGRSRPEHRRHGRLRPRVARQRVLWSRTRSIASSFRRSTRCARPAPRSAGCSTRGSC